MNLLINLFLVFFVLVALLMVLVILMQRPKSEGLGAAFGGGVTENIFGAQTTNVLVKFTTWLTGIFFAITFALSILYAHRGTGGESAFRRELMKSQAAPQTSPAPATASQPSPVSSPAPNSGTGALPEGTATPETSPTAQTSPPQKP
jgi:preprotein translocase subunit SecG